MREIKFRVWNGEYMVSPDNIDRTGTAWWYENSIPQTSKNLMQFTGLKDKNGKEIYEGDIMKIIGYTTVEFQSGSFVAKKDSNTWILGLFDVYGKLLDCEVIGNIYENPELLK